MVLFCNAPSLKTPFSSSLCSHRQLLIENNALLLSDRLHCDLSCQRACVSRIQSLALVLTWTPLHSLSSTCLHAVVPTLPTLNSCCKLSTTASSFALPEPSDKHSRVNTNVAHLLTRCHIEADLKLSQVVPARKIQVGTENSGKREKIEIQLQEK